MHDVTAWSESVVLQKRFPECVYVCVKQTRRLLMYMYSEDLVKLNWKVYKTIVDKAAAAATDWIRPYVSIDLYYRSDHTHTHAP